MYHLYELDIVKYYKNKFHGKVFIISQNKSKTICEDIKLFRIKKKCNEYNFPSNTQ